MTDLIKIAASRRARDLLRKIKRFKLVYVHCGIAFEILREEMFAQVGGVLLNAEEFAIDSGRGQSDSLVVLDGLESFATTGKSGAATLGQLRVRVNDLRDRGVEVCLVSRLPKISFSPVAGSSLLSDATQHYLALLDGDECLPDLRKEGSVTMLPAIGLDSCADQGTVIRHVVEGLGIDVLTELDFVMFEAGHEASLVGELSPLAADALRGAGLAYVENGEAVFSIDGPFWRFRDAVADVIAKEVNPQADLPDVARGIWQIERIIRMKLRDAAVDNFGVKWRKSLLGEELTRRVLERARDDVGVTARSIAELRDPIEWLSLGELMDVVEAKPFSGLFWDGLAWRHFRQAVGPIRNRLSHMRLLKSGDRATVYMWLNRLVRAS